MIRWAIYQIEQTPNLINQGIKKGNYFVNQIYQAVLFNLLKKNCSPEQISGHLKLEHSSFEVFHETIYKFIYSEEGSQQKLSI